MDMQATINQAEQNIRQALKDYAAHTTRHEELDDVSDAFIKRLARDSSYAKQDLRELFSKSPVWRPDLDALVINGTRTHNPDPERIMDLATRILHDPLLHASIGRERMIYSALRLFYQPDMSEVLRADSIACLNELAPKAYTPTKKLSRVFKALCVALGVADESSGSDFQRLYAQFADELSAKKIGFKLFVSINPAHFITMSNPKFDRRGNTLTSCHSFNSTEYEYNNGCSGYARDETSFIVFTVADPMDAETLNNRKTTRQIFAYRPGSGLLMQSRMYNTAGGVYGAAEDSKLYRDLVQREISMLEDVPNLWKTVSSYGDRSFLVRAGEDFGGYRDWTYSSFDGHISIRNDCADDVEPLVVGASGLCIKCGEETSRGLYCEDCDGAELCDCCNERARDLHDVHDEDGSWIRVCDNCLDNSYTYCDCCEEYWPNDMIRGVNGGNYVCDICIDQYYERCERCDEYYRSDDMTRAMHHGNSVWVCEDCLEDDYIRCEDCGDYHFESDVIRITLTNGGLKFVCESCASDYEICPHCDERIVPCENGTCPSCGAVIEEVEVSA